MADEKQQWPNTFAHCRLYMTDGLRMMQHFILNVIAALHGHLEVVDLVIRVAAYPVEPRDSCGTTPLMDSVRAGHVPVARRLVEQSFTDSKTTDRAGRSALHLAAQVPNACQFIDCLSWDCFCAIGWFRCFD